jgi:hypothetical protein
MLSIELSLLLGKIVFKHSFLTSRRGIRLNRTKTRIEIEAQYAAALDRLAKKTFPILKNEGGPIRTSTEAWRRVYESTTALAMNHQKLVYNIDWVMDTLNKA